MQLITSKILPPTPPSLLNAIARNNARVKDAVILKLGLKYCPSMDLVATYPILKRHATYGSKGEDNKALESYGYNDDEDDAVSVHVWRLNGQMVFKVDVEGEDGQVDICDVEWRDDGQILAIISSDNTIRLVNSFSGKTVFRFPSVSMYSSPKSPASSFRLTEHSQVLGSTTPAQDSKPKATVSSFATHFLDPSLVASRLQHNKDDAGLDDLLSLNADISKLLKSPADLPKELASIDVEAFLPKLSCLPPAGFGAEDVFSTRSAIDTIFHASKRNLTAGTVDVLVVGTNKGTIHLRIFDSFEIGDINLNTANSLPKVTICSKVHQINTHPYSSKNLVFAEFAKIGQLPQLHLLSLDLKFMHRSSTTLPVLVTKSAQLQNLILYLTQIQSQLTREVKTAFDIPSRFVRVLAEDLEKQDGEGASFSTAAYHAIVTGEVNGVFKEWLAEVLGERGVKRWEKAVLDCLELVRRLISENWNPAVEHCSVVVSRLTGLAGCNTLGAGEGTTFGIDKKTVEELRDIIDIMAICGEELLREVNRELHGFSSFSKWLKWEVEAAGLEATSERLDEMRENMDHTETLKVLEYIERSPVDTIVKNYIGTASGKQQDTGNADNTIGVYATFKEMRKGPLHHREIPTFDRLLSRMERQSKKLFEQVACTLKEDIMVEYLASIPQMMDSNVMDSRIVLQAENGKLLTHIVARHTGKLGSLLYAMVKIEKRQTQNKTSMITTEEIQPPDTDSILDVKFIDDTKFMVLVSSAGQVQLYSHTIIEYGSIDEGWELRHTFIHGLMDSGMQPGRIEINGRKGRRAVAIIDQEGKGYSVFDLDSDDTNQEEDDGDQIMSD